MLMWSKLCVSIKFTPTKERNELGLLKGILLSMDNGMGRHLRIAQVGSQEKYWYVSNDANEMMGSCSDFDENLI